MHIGVVCPQSSIPSFPILPSSLFSLRPLCPCASVPLCLRAFVAKTHPLHLSRLLYKSPLFAQNKPNPQNPKMNVSSIPTKDYRNIAAFTPRKNKPNQTQSCPSAAPNEAVLSPNTQKSSHESSCRYVSNSSGFIVVRKLPLCPRYSTSFQGLPEYRFHHLICLISKAFRTAFEPSRPGLAGSG